MVTREQAMTKRHFEHVTKTNSDGTPMRCRANGACKTWKTRPGDFRLPVKRGLWEFGYITPENAADWNVAG